MAGEPEEVPNDDATEVEAEGSIADDLRAAWAEQGDETETQAAASADGEEPNDDETPDEGEAAQALASGTDESGGGPDDEQDGETQAGDESGAAPIEAPQHWSQEDRETFAKLDPAGQSFLSRRHREMEADYTRKTQEVAGVQRALEPYKEQMALAGVTPEAAITRLVTAQQRLETAPVETTAWLAEQYIRTPDDAQRVIQAIAGKHGIDLGEDFEDADTDPKIANVQRELAELRSTIAQREQTEQSQTQQQYQAQIDAFRDAKDDQGQPAHPHFDAVKATMGTLIASGQATSLDDAYERAVWVEPSLRQQALEAERKAAAEAAEKAAKTARVTQAKGAKQKQLPRGGASSGGGAKVNPDATLADDIRAAMDAVG